MKMCVSYFRDFINLSTFLYLILRVFRNKEKKCIDRLSKLTSKCGPLAIKLLQFILMNNENINALNFVFENCESHSLEATKELYLTDFGRNLSDDYTDIEFIASGSIGQVYRAYSLEHSCFVAIKVKHPGIEKSISRFTKIVKIICFIIKPFNKFHELITRYLTTLNIQLDYVGEALNTIILRDNWIDEPLVIVPKVYRTGNNFIVMSYHEAINFNEIKLQDQQLVGLYMNFIVLKSILIDDFLHGDLHTGNWKVLNENGTIKIVIYDCGLISKTGDLEYNKRLVDNLVSGSFQQLLYTVADPGVNIKKLKQCQEIIKKSLPENSVKRTQFFIDLALSKKISSDYKFISTLNAFGIIGQIIGVGVSVFNKYMVQDPDLETTIYTYIGLLKNMECFSSLRIFFEKWMMSDPIHKLNYERWLFNEFGHTKGYILDDIIFKKFKQL
jgi:hypothetical protein